jgi:4-carboxymuconolactone decarboxylase
MHSAPIWLSSLAIAAAGGWFAATLVAQPATGKAPRFPQLTMDQLDEKQKPLGEQIMKVSSVGLGGPYNPMIRSPVLGQRLFDLFYYLRWQTSVPSGSTSLRSLSSRGNGDHRSSGLRTRRLRPKPDSRPISSPS